MSRFIRYAVALCLLSLSILRAGAESGTVAVRDPLESADGLTLVNVRAEPVTHRGQRGLRVISADPGLRVAEAQSAPRELLAIANGSRFHNGTIEVELAGAPTAGEPGMARGFVGVAFRVQTGETPRYDCFYIRPANGRAEDQERRNHSAQYISHPEYTWSRLRQETPSRYEVYVDLVPDEWTKVRIVVQGTEARLYVHDAAQPALIVKDLKQGDVSGAVALWLEPSTTAHFRNLRISP
jgi:hypothetical protein